MRGDGDDLVTGGPGNEPSTAGLEPTSSFYSGTRSQYTITADGAGGYYVVDNFAQSNGDDGSDRIVNVETLRFSDGDFSPSSTNTGIFTMGRKRLTF